jgi:hypothetical protein
MIQSDRDDGNEALAQMIRQQICQRTWGRIRQLQIEANDDRVIVRGYSPSYYLVQLTLAAIRGVVASTPVELDVQVVGLHSSAPQGRNRPHATSGWQPDRISGSKRNEYSHA